MRQYDRPLSAKRRAFIKEYLARGFNGKAAALAVYRCKPSSAASIASQVLKDPRVQEELRAAFTIAGMDTVSFARQLKAVIEHSYDWPSVVKGLWLYARVCGII